VKKFSELYFELFGHCPKFEKQEGKNTSAWFGALNVLITHGARGL